LTRLRRSPELILGLLAVAVFVAWAASEGGYVPTSLYPGALFVLGLLVVTTVAYRDEVRRLPRVNAIALALLAAFTLWSFVAISWADDKAIAWDGANRTMLYLTIFALFTLPRWRASSAATVLGVYSLGVAVVGAALVLDVTGSGDPELSFITERLADPTGYPNATAALFAAASFPAFFLASRRETPWPARGLSLAVAAFLVQLALIPQSRGAFIVFPIAVVLYFAVVPARVRSVIVLIPVAAATALAAPALLDVFDSVGKHADLAAALDRAGRAMAVSAVVLFVLGAALGLVDRRLSVPERTSVIAERGFGVAAAVGAIVAVVVFVGAVGSPVSWAGDRWDDLKGGYSTKGFDGSRFGSDLGSNRYDFWRVAISDEFASAPVRGIGTDNFAIPYLRERTSDEAPLYPHSLPIGILAGTGLVGATLFLGFLGCAVAAALRNRRTRERFANATSAAALVTFAYWFMHSSGDWLWAFPGLGGPAIASLALAGRIGTGAGPDEPPTEPQPSGAPQAASILALVAGVLVAAFAALSYGLPWAAQLDVDAARSDWESDPAAALDRLDRARGLNFLSSEPDVVAGSIAQRLGDEKRMRTDFERALEREPDNWLPLLELGGLDAARGRRAAALQRLRRARELNPLDPLIRRALRRAEAGHPITVAEINRALVERVCDTVGRTHDTRSCR
jgi:O-antigen ligase